MRDEYQARRELAITLMRQYIETVRSNQYFTDANARMNYRASRAEILAALDWTMEQLQTPSDIRREFELINRKLDDLLKAKESDARETGPAE